MTGTNDSKSSPDSNAHAADRGLYPFIQARYCTPANRTAIDLVVIHTMEAPQEPKTARRVANWFASAGSSKASAHYCVDDQEIIQCVREQDIAWHAPGANQNGIGVEHAGYASQTPADWAGLYSQKMLQLSASLVADICRRYSIPVQFVSSAELVAKKRGITTHAAVSAAFHQSTHTDPGPNFPMEDYLRHVAAVGSDVAAVALERRVISGA